MVEIIICDDQNIVTKNLSKYILDRIIIKKLNISVKSFLTGKNLIQYLTNAPSKKRIILLDIDMIPMNGLSVAKYIRNKLNDYSSEIIFVTGTNGYERDLFGVRPSGFIPKPVDYNYLSNTLSNVYNRINAEISYFHYSQHGIKKSIRVDDIIYFENMNRKIEVVTTNQTDWFYQKMSTLSEQLSEHPQFIVCHRSFLINSMKVVRKNGSNLIMSDNKVIPISRKKLKSVEKSLLNFL